MLMRKQMYGSDGGHGKWGGHDVRDKLGSRSHLVPFRDVGRKCCH